jgi:hypothetical protein
MDVLRAVGADRGRRWAGGLLAAAMAAAAGCGRSDSLPSYQVYEVKGRVLLADGKPLPGGFVTLVPKGDLPLSPGAEIGPDGTFSVVTGGSGEGAPAGDYKVRVEAPQLGTPAPRSRKKPVVPVRYTDEDSSGLVITVKPEANHLDPIVLK